MLFFSDHSDDTFYYINHLDARYCLLCCHFKTFFSSQLHPDTEVCRSMTTRISSNQFIGLLALYANLHTDQEHDYFIHRYDDRLSTYGCTTC